MLAFEHVMPSYVDVLRGRTVKVGVIRTLASILDKYSGEVVKRRPRVVRPGEVARVGVEVEGGGVPLERGARVVLREGGRTVGAGLVESFE